jgi:cytochrome c5
VLAGLLSPEWGWQREQNACCYNALFRTNTKHAVTLMSEQHPDAIEANIESHPVKLAVWITVGSVALIVAIALLAHFARVVYGFGETSSEKAASTPEKTNQRIAPVAQLVAIDESLKPAVAVKAAVAEAPVQIVAAAIPSADAAPVAATDGAGVYNQACTACHGAGIAGAPKTGDKGAWGARVAKGKPTLYDHAIKGVGAMPAKGGNASLSDDAVKAAVDYMLAQVK